MMRMLYVLLPQLVVVLVLTNSRVVVAQFQVPSTRAYGQNSQRSYRSHGDAWIARDDETTGAAVPYLECETSVPGLEDIREQKRQTIQAIRARIEKLMRSTPSTTPVVRSMTDRQTQSTPSNELLPPKPELPIENPSDQHVPFPKDPGPADSVAPVETPENAASHLEPNSQSSLVIPEMSPLDGLAPSAKATTPTTGDVNPKPVVESPVVESPALVPETAEPRSPIADMIEALAKTETAEQPSNPEADPVESPSSLSATTVLNSPVDRLKLADNLFATGEYSLALQMYDAAGSKGSKLGNDDRAWVTYQKAGCYRRLEMMDEAESLYRQAAGDADAEWLAKVARWWLDRIAEREKLKQEIGQVKEVLDTFKKAKLDANTNSQ